MADRVDIRNIPTPIGLIRHIMSLDPGPAWLRLDGVTDYARAEYPDFLAMFGRASWVLPGSSAAKFRLFKVPAGTATVASGFELEAGSMIGSDSVTLTLAMLPEHDHGYGDSTVSAEIGKAGLLSGVLPVATGLKAAETARTTAKAGSAKPVPVPIKPPGFVAHLFIFAGRPRR